ncbi:RNA polymerase sigma factor [Paraliomyxa miuraensis]|uniref:RNA polymerase sigma factor n=1 Tax=Paraliomyxa miuraensis TaxID=376150 RepID=UPI00225A60C3|nr:sigma-70 family RNA polymerase sigma factor [Paraliomyxa miuraensis]MCX4241495.1 sigma-70 family RNA polymerase sigma factor [Paraliomyxa miuraensis]
MSNAIDAVIPLHAVAGDPELLAAWREGDSRAGQELFARYFEPVSRFFANKVSTDHEDLIQETFEACLRGRDRLRNDGSFRSYLFSVAFNVLKVYFRRMRATEHVGELGSASIHDIAPGPSTLVGAAQQEQLLLDGLRRIPMDLQVVLEMRYWEDMSSTEIGTALGIPAATARSRLVRGRELLERAIAQLPANPHTRDSTLAELEDWLDRIRATLQVVPA